MGLEDRQLDACMDEWVDGWYYWMGEWIGTYLSIHKVLQLMPLDLATNRKCQESRGN